MKTSTQMPPTSFCLPGCLGLAVLDLVLLRDGLVLAPGRELLVALLLSLALLQDLLLQLAKELGHLGFMLIGWETTHENAKFRDTPVSIRKSPQLQIFNGTYLRDS